LLHPSLQPQPLAQNIKAKQVGHITTMDIGNVTSESDLAFLFQPLALELLPVRTSLPLPLLLLMIHLRRRFRFKFKCAIESWTNRNRCASSAL